MPRVSDEEEVLPALPLGADGRLELARARRYDEEGGVRLAGAYDHVFDEVAVDPADR